MIGVSLTVPFTVLLAPELFALARSTRLEAMLAWWQDGRDLSGCIERADDQDSAAGESNDTLGDRPHQKVAESSPTMRSHDDQLGTKIGRELSDLARRILTANVRHQPRKAALRLFLP